MWLGQVWLGLPNLVVPQWLVWLVWLMLWLLLCRMRKLVLPQPSYFYPALHRRSFDGGLPKPQLFLIFGFFFAGQEEVECPAHLQHKHALLELGQEHTRKTISFR